MDLFYYSPEHLLLVCKPCARVVYPAEVPTHLDNNHRYELAEPTDLTHPDRKITWRARGRVVTNRLRERYALLDPTKGGVIPLPPPGATPIPFLPLHRSFECTRCTYIQLVTKKIAHHWNQVHRTTPRTPGGQTYAAKKKLADEGPMWTEVDCQRFTPSRPYFRVTIPTVPDGVTPIPAYAATQTSLEDVILGTLDANDTQVQLASQIFVNQPVPSEVSPWLERTRWRSFLDGLDLKATAALINDADPITEPTAHTLGESLDRLVERAHASIRNDRINAFDQIRINSFVTAGPTPSNASRREIFIKLQKGTFRQYKFLWKRLLAFVCRTSWPDFQLPLRHRFTPGQLACLDEAYRRASEFRRRPSNTVRAALDRACLLLCITLLDHPLKGDIFESPVLAFLAVLGIDPRPNAGVFRGPLSYSSELSKFIKIAQMLVVERAVLAADEKVVEHPSGFLEQLRARFLVYGTDSPFEWASKLRSYAKKLIDTITTDGYIEWSDDMQEISYKDTRLTLAGFRDFVAEQVRLSQAELHDLLLIHPDECRDELIPPVHLHQLKDDHRNGNPGYNFLQHPANAAYLTLGAPKKSGDRWLISRVLANDWLRDNFIESAHGTNVRWNREYVRDYVNRVHLFLQRLLLLVHVTSGQPARGTEILSLQHTNTTQGHHRSIFVDHGMISTVTSYHKGYTCTGSTKIIHRYLPKEVGELVVYYLWLVLPFWQQLLTLAGSLDTKKKSKLGKGPPASTPLRMDSFLWTPSTGKTATQLTSILQREATAHLNTKLSTSLYRHLAIAMSRQHLKSGGFKRDYGNTNESAADAQAAHGTWIAGAMYARSLTEGQGHVAGKQHQYRQVSREWHDFLGFRNAIASLRRPIDDLGEVEEPARQRRRYASPRREGDDDPWQF